MGQRRPSLFTNTSQTMQECFILFSFLSLCLAISLVLRKIYKVRNIIFIVYCVTCGTTLFTSNSNMITHTLGLEFTYEDLEMINNEQFIFNTFNIILNDSFKSVNDSNVLTTKENYFGNDFVTKPKNITFENYNCELNNDFSNRSITSDVLVLGLEFIYEDLEMINVEQFVFNTFNIILNDSFKSVNDSNVLTTRENYFGNDFVTKPKNITFEYYNCELNNVFSNRSITRSYNDNYFVSNWNILQKIYILLQMPNMYECNLDNHYIRIKLLFLCKYLSKTKFYVDNSKSIKKVRVLYRNCDTLATKFIVNFFLRFIRITVFYIIWEHVFVCTDRMDSVFLGSSCEIEPSSGSRYSSFQPSFEHLNFDTKPMTTLLIMILLHMCGDTAALVNPGPINQSIDYTHLEKLWEEEKITVK